MFIFQSCSQSFMTYLNNNARKLGELITYKLGTPDVTDGLVMAGTGTMIIASGTYSVAAGVTQILYTAAAIGVSKTSETFAPHIKEYIVPRFVGVIPGLEPPRRPVEFDPNRFSFQTVRFNKGTEKWYVVEDLENPSCDLPPSEPVTPRTPHSSGLIVGNSEVSDDDSASQCLVSETED